MVGSVKAVITGAAGLFGANFSRHLLDAGWEVVGIDDLSGGHREFLPENSNFEFSEMSLNAYTELISLAKRASPDVIYHFAAYAAEGLSPFVRRFNYEQNLLASAGVINAAIEVEAKLVFTSSMAVYGMQEPPFSEQMSRLPIDPYGIAKMATELDIEVAGEQHGLRFSIVRPHNVIGRFQNIWDRYRNVVGIFIRRGLQGLPLCVYGSGSQKRAFSDIQFYMEPLEKLASEGDGEIYNLGSDDPRSVLDVAKIVSEELALRGLAPEIEFYESRHEVFEAYCSHEKAKKELGFSDQTNLQLTVSDMIDWAVSEPDRSVRETPYEIDKGLYEFWK